MGHSDAMKKRCSRNWSTEKFYFAERFLQRCGTFHRLVTHVVSCKHLRVAPLNVATFGAAHLAVVGVVQSASSRCIAPLYCSSAVVGRPVTNTGFALLHPMQTQASSHCIGTCTRHVLLVRASSLWTADLHKCSVPCTAPCKCRHLRTASKHRTVSA